MVLDGNIKHLVLFDYGLLDKICDKVKYLISKNVVLQIVLIIIFERSKLIHIILCLLKKILTFHNIIIIIKQMLIRIKKILLYYSFRKWFV